MFEIATHSILLTVLCTKSVLLSLCYYVVLTEQSSNTHGSLCSREPKRATHTDEMLDPARIQNISLVFRAALFVALRR